MGRPKGSKNSTEGVKKNNKVQTTTHKTGKRGRTIKSTTTNGIEPNTGSQKAIKELATLTLDEKIDPSLFDDLPPSKRQKTDKETTTKTTNITKTIKKVTKPVKKVTKAVKGPTATTTQKKIKPKNPPTEKKVVIKPLFSAKARRSNFNPLPKTQINQINNPPSSSSSQNELEINTRCGNLLNSFKFEKYQWKKDDLIETQHLLIFGAGDMGQMGLGPEKLDDVRKPGIHSLIEELKGNGRFGIPIHLAAGGMHSLVIDSNGKIWSWGINDNAALGRKTEGIEGVEQEELETRPMEVSNLFPQLDSSNPSGTPFKAARVSAGDSVSVAINEDGELVAWGSFRSNDGLLGFDGNVGTSAKQLMPTRVSNLRDYPVAQVVCGYDHVLALTTDGQVYSWGNGQQQQLGRKIIERRKKNGLTPERLALKKIVLVGSGGSHSFAVNEDGMVFGWGLNTRGQLGISSEESIWEDEIVSIPTPVRSMSPDQHDGARVIAIEGGDFHTLFLLNNGQVWAVGSYENGEIGVKRSTPEILVVEKERKEGVTRKEEFIEEDLKIRKAKFDKVLAKYNERNKGKMEEDEDDPRPQWDEMNERMEAEQEAASRGFVPGQCLRTPVQVEFTHPIIDISCGTRHNLAVDNQGNAYSWGLGLSNELGQGKDEDGEEIEMLESPKLLTGKALTQGSTERNKLKVISCAAGGTHSLLIAAKIQT